MTSIIKKFCPYCQEEHNVEIHYVNEDDLDGEYYLCPKTKKSFGPKKTKDKD